MCSTSLRAVPGYVKISSRFITLRATPQLMALCQCHRVMIARTLKGLEDVIPIYVVHEIGKEGWEFKEDPRWRSLAVDPLYGFTQVRQIYLKAKPDYDGRITVPILWDTKTETIVNNESSEILRMFWLEFEDIVPLDRRNKKLPSGGFYPEPLRKDIDEMNEWVYHTINNGVYKCGFAKSQTAYDENIFPLFASLDRVDAHLQDPRHRPYLFGKTITEADVRLFPTIARFDVAYYTVFNCNLKMIRYDYPNIYRWFRGLYWDQSDVTRGAFHEHTAPYLGLYAEGYAASQQKALHGVDTPVIIPRGPAKLIEPLDEDV
jgi:glutathionyl-hydroquinone reductase